MIRILFVLLGLLSVMPATALDPPVRVIFTTALDKHGRPLDQVDHFDPAQPVYVWIGWAGLEPQVSHVARITVYSPDGRRQWGNSYTFMPTDTYAPTWWWYKPGPQPAAGTWRFKVWMDNTMMLDRTINAVLPTPPQQGLPAYGYGFLLVLLLWGLLALSWRRRHRM